MKDKTSHNLAVRKPLSKVYLALFSAPLILIGPADVARADDAIFDGESRITESLTYTGDVYVGRNQSGNLLIDNGQINAYNVNIGRRANGQIYESLVTVKGPNAVLNAINDQSVMHGSLNLGLGTLRVEEGGLATAEEIIVGTTGGYDSHLNVKGAGSQVISERLGLGFGQGARSTLLIEDGGVVTTTAAARIDSVFAPTRLTSSTPKPR
jgi:T5SS/PEP-CTERM-associated repeat protein